MNPVVQASKLIVGNMCQKSESGVTNLSLLPVTLVSLKKVILVAAGAFAGGFVFGLLAIIIYNKTW